MEQTITVQGTTWARDCSLCNGEGVIEEAVFGRFAAESTRETPCPRCDRFGYRRDQRAWMSRLYNAARDARRTA